jgi:uncharacterized protein (DUF305 family)
VTPSGGRHGIGAGHVLIALVVLAAAGALLVLLPRGTSTPSDTSPEAGFARDMQVHHAQAVQMAFMMRDKISDPVLRSITFDIITTQQQQSGQMAAWLQAWHLPPTGSQRPMAWMAGHHSGGTTAVPAVMPGMATEAQLKQLQEATGPGAERLFLQLMIAHHEGGIEMADAVLASTVQPEVRQLASAIATSQRAEIEQMTQMLDALGAASAQG